MIWHFVAAALLAPAIFFLLVAWRAPEGWEDEDGFHFGRRWRKRRKRAEPEQDRENERDAA